MCCCCHARRLPILLLLALLAAPSFASGAEAYTPDPEIEAIQRAIDAADAQWTAKRNWTSDLAPEDRSRLLGHVVPPEIQRRFDALDPVDFTIHRDLPDSFSWRNQGILTPVKSQDTCGSCWDFAAIGALEAVVKQTTGIEYDLSEQQVLSCASQGWGCDGAWAETAWSYIKEHGSAGEACMPYAADDTVPCDDDGCTMYATTKEWIDIPNDVDIIKTALMDQPLTIGFTVYTDFFSYADGCYEYVSGDEEGGHLVLLVGWDDSKCGPGDGAWLCKNSWDTDWGNLGGYFWIKYGDSGIGRSVQKVLYYPGDSILYSGSGISDPTGDGDGWADPAEEIELQVALENEIVSPERLNVTATLSTDSPHVVVTQPLSSYGSMDPGETKWGLSPYGFTVSEFATPGAVVEFELTISADGRYSNVDTLEVVLGQVPVLLVDDDEDETTEAYFEDSLERIGYPHNKWTETIDGLVTLETMQRHTVVVWTSGWLGDFEAANLDTLSAFLDGGGLLFISGQDIGYRLVEVGDPEENQFYEDYLHADYIRDDAIPFGAATVTGATGDPIGDGLYFPLDGIDSAQNQEYPSEIEPRTGATSIFTYQSSGTRDGGIRYKNEHGVVYTAFGLEGATGAAVRDTIMRRTLRWLAGDDWPDMEQPTVGLVTPNGGESIPPGSEYEIAWTASDNVGVTSIDILRSLDSGATFSDVIASGETNDGSFVWTVPGTPNSTSRIRVVARDAAGLAWYDDSDADFSVENTPPTITVDAPAAEGELATSVYEISWTGYDTDPGSSLEVDLYYCDPESCTAQWPVTDTTGAAAQSLPNTPPSFLWDVSSIAAGEYRVFGRISDGELQATDCSDGTTLVNHEPWISVDPQSGIVEVEDSYTVTWIADDPDTSDSLSIDLLYDIDTDPAAMETVALGLENTGSHEWDTSGLEPGSYFYMFARASDGTTDPAVDYSGGQVHVIPPVGPWPDVAAIAGVNDDGNAMAVAWGDYDGDGYDDLYVVNTDGPNKLFHNEGDGIFADAGIDTLEDPGDSRSAAWADYNSDGYLDLYVSNSGTANRLFRNDGSGVFVDVAPETDLADVGQGRAVAWADYDRDNLVDLYLGKRSGANRLYRNLGGDVFEDVASQLGVAVTSFTGGVAWCDYDMDGWPDLFMTTTSADDRLFRNDGGTFTDVAATAGLADAGHGRGAAWGDYDNDGDFDLFVSMNGPGKLFENEGGVFANVAAGTPLETITDGYGVVWFDGDLDGDLDLYVGDATSANKYFENNGGGVFTDATAGALGTTATTYGAASGDYDTDGDADLYVATYGSNQLLLNNTPAEKHWLTVKLEGRLSNRSAVGARVAVASNGLRQMREVSGGAGCHSQESLGLEFGLGESEAADTVRVMWPSGIVEVLTNVSADQVLEMVEGDVTGIPEDTIAAHGKPTVTNYPNPFNPATLIRYELPVACDVTLRIYDLSGRLVRELASHDAQIAGVHEVTWFGQDDEGRPVASGVYFYQLETETAVLGRKMILLK